MSLPNPWPIVPFAVVVENCDSRRVPVKASDRGKRAGPYPYYGASGVIDAIDDYLFDGEHLLIGEDGANLLARSTPIAFRAYGKFWVNNHAHVVRFNGTAELRFLEYFFARLDLRPYLTGSTQPKLTRENLDRIPIPLPPLPEQRRIADILDKADAVRRKRKEAIALTEELLRSAFLEMFGDPVTNPKGWPARPLAGLLTFLTSGSRGWSEYYAETGDLFLRIQNVRDDLLDLEDVAYVRAPETAEARRTEVEAGDVLLSITADLGRTAVVPDGLSRAFINQHLAILRTAGIEPEYLSAFLASAGGQHQFQRLNRHGVKAGLNFDDIRGVQVLMPPISEQRRFVRVKLKTRELRQRLLWAATEADTLMGALVQRAFRGELTRGIDLKARQIEMFTEAGTER